MVRCQAITAVYDRGVPLTFNADYSTSAALLAATIPSGNYATCKLARDYFGSTRANRNGYGGR
jgi:D-alanyl-D-alanine carboxypeptidase